MDTMKEARKKSSVENLIIIILKKPEVDVKITTTDRTNKLKNKKPYFLGIDKQTPRSLNQIATVCIRILEVFLTITTKVDFKLALPYVTNQLAGAPAHGDKLLN